MVASLVARTRRAFNRFYVFEVTEDAPLGKLTAPARCIVAVLAFALVVLS